MNQITRRSFLKTSAAASALAVNFVPSRVFGANDRVRIGIAGINGRGQSHMGAYLGMKNVEVSHLIDPDSRLFKSRGKKVADKQGGKMPICVQDVREALEDKNLDAVSVATCNHWHSLITIWAISVLSFVIIQLPPGDFATTYVEQQMGGPALVGTPAARVIEANLRRDYGLDKPLFWQYAKWASKFVRLDFGISLEYRRPVREVVGERLFMTVILAGSTALLAWGLSIPIGIYSAYRRNSIFDRASSPSSKGLLLFHFILLLIIFRFKSNQKDREFFKIEFLIFLFIKAPPPKAMTVLFFLRHSSTSFSSSSLKNFSPLFSKIFRIFIEYFFSIFKSVSTNSKLSFLATILPKADFPTPIIPNKTRFFFTVLVILNLIFHNYVLFFECKYYLINMQLRLKPRTNRNFISRILIIKTILILLVFFIGIFLLDKIDFPTPIKVIKQEIRNDKFLTLK